MTANSVGLSQTRPEPQAAVGHLGHLDTPRVALLVLFGAFLLGVASLFYLNLAASVAASSARLQDLTRERRMLEWQRTDKARELAQLTHPERLEHRATELGYRAPRGVTYVTVPPDVAATLDIPTHPAAQATVEATPRPGLWAALQQQFERWLGH